MASLTLKDLPPRLLTRLRALAARERRSLNQEAIALLEGAVAAHEDADDRAQRQVKAWRALAGQWASEATFDDEVDALYAARTAGRDVEL
jgi:plasmid stability protein